MHSVIAALTQWLEQEQPDALLIGFSGGVDSVVLLHALNELKPKFSLKLRALHVNHQLQAEADQWQQFCESTAKTLGVPCVVEKVVINQHGSIEALARDARYSAFSAHLQSSEVLLTAHHQQDQVESVLLNLFRGTGINGLAGIPAQRWLGSNPVAIPLLGVSKVDIEKYATANQLSFVSDPSNADSTFNRNFIRNEVLPLIRQRWPQVDQSIARCASHCKDGNDLLQRWSEEQLRVLAESGPLNLSEFALQDDVAQKHILWHWLQESTGLTPTSADIDEILVQMLAAGADRQPKILLGGWAIRRFKAHLYAVKNVSVNPHWEQQVVLDKDVLLPNGDAYRLESITRVMESDLPMLRCPAAADRISVGFRKDGAHIKLAGGTKSVKKLLQSANIPPWERAQIPMLYINDELVAIGEQWVDQRWISQHENGCKVRIKKAA